MDTLQLAPLLRAGVKYANGTYRSDRHFLDFIVNGRSLWEALGRRHDMVSILCVEFSAEETARAVKRLLLNERAALPNNRRSLFVCSECGDLGCGTITARIERGDGTIRWENFGYENTYEAEVRFDDYAALGPLTFDAVDYEGMLLEAVANLRNR
jgi:hypothetical protein